MNKSLKILLIASILFILWLITLKNEFEIHNVIVSPALAYQEAIMNFGSEPENEMVIVQNSAIWGGSGGGGAILPLKTAENAPYSQLEGNNAILIADLIRYYSRFYGVDENLMLAVVKCESNFNPQAIGDHGRAKGLWQIWTSLHPISEDCAFDADCSTEWAIRQIADGRGSLWTCWRKLTR